MCYFLCRLVVSTYHVMDVLPSFHPLKTIIPSWCFLIQHIQNKVILVQFELHFHTKQSYTYGIGLIALGGLRAFKGLNSSLYNGLLLASLGSPLRPLCSSSPFPRPFFPCAFRERSRKSSVAASFGKRELQVQVFFFMVRDGRRARLGRGECWNAPAAARGGHFWRVPFKPLKRRRIQSFSGLVFVLWCKSRGIVN
jgi:hypothetical protein